MGDVSKTLENRTFVAHCLPSLYSGIRALFTGKLWEAYLMAGLFK